MASTISAGTTSTTALVYSADTSGVLQLQTNGTTTAVTIDTSQRVGIGTTSPGSQLEVSSSNTAIRVTDTSTGYAWTRYANNSTNFFVGMDTSTGSQFGTAYARVLWGQGAYPMVFATNNTEQMRIDTNGNLGLGVTPSAWGSSYKALAISTESNFYASTNQDGITLNAYNDNTNWKYTTNDYATKYTQYAGAHYWSVAPSGTAGNTISFTQAMTLTNNGLLGIGCTAPYATLQVVASGVPITSGTSYGGTIVQNNGGTPYDAAQHLVAGSSGNARFIGGYSTGASNLTIVAEFYSDNTNTRACVRANQSNGVYLGSGGTSWNSLSDERSKENLVPITDAVNKVLSLRAVTGNYIADQTKKSRSFLIAQDVEKVLPEAVDTSDPKEYGLAYTDVIPLLVSAIKELSAQVTTLQSQVAALTPKA